MEEERRSKVKEGSKGKGGGEGYKEVDELTRGGERGRRGKEEECSEGKREDGK